VESSAKDFKSMYSLGKVLGKGNFSVVRQAVNKTTGETVAVKCIDPKSLSKEDAEALVIEIDVLKNVSHCLSVVWDCECECVGFVSCPQCACRCELLSWLINDVFPSE
jgi:serine/threonine protein kinase